MSALPPTVDTSHIRVEVEPDPLTGLEQAQAGLAILLCVLSLPATLWAAGTSAMALVFGLDALFSGGLYSVMGATGLLSAAMFGLKALVGGALSLGTIGAAGVLFVKSERAWLGRAALANLVHLVAFGIFWSLADFGLSIFEDILFVLQMNAEYGDGLGFGSLLDPSLLVMDGIPMVITMVLALIGVVFWGWLAASFPRS